MSDSNPGPPPPGDWQPDPADVSPFEPPYRSQPPPPPSAQLPPGHAPPAPPPYQGPATYQPQPQSQPLPPVPPMPPQRKSGRWKWFVGLGLLILLGVGGCVYFVFSLVGEPKEAANDFMTAMVEDRISDAEELLHPGCPLTNVALTSVFPEGVESFSFNSSSVRSTSGSPTVGVVSGSVLLGGDTSTRSLTVELQKRDDTWLVCALGYR